MSLSAEQMAARQHFVGASEVAAILGIDPHRTAFDVWAQKKKLVPPQPDMPWLRRGHKLEPVIVSHYADRHPGSMFDTFEKTIVHPVFPWLGATPDRLVHLPTDERLLECKSKRSFQAQAWGEDGAADGVPSYVVAQVQIQLACVGLEVADVGLLIDGEEYREYQVARDDELCRMIVEQVEEFWMRHMEGDEQPELEGRTVDDYLQRRFAKHSTDFRAASADEEHWMTGLSSIKRQIKMLKAEEDRVTLRLKAATADAGGILGKAGKFNWYDRAGSPRYKELATALGATPEQIEQYRGAPTRVAKFTPAGEEE